MGGMVSAGCLLLIFTMTGFGAPPRLSKHVGLLTCESRTSLMYSPFQASQCPEARWLCNLRLTGVNAAAIALASPSAAACSAGVDDHQPLMLISRPCALLCQAM